MSIPYVYYLLSKGGHIYVGSRTAENSDPKELWEKYFSSSSYVHDLITKHGVDYFEVVGIEVFNSPEDAFWEEQNKIKEFFGNEMLLNKHYQNEGTTPFTQLGRKGEKQFMFGKGDRIRGSNNPMFGKKGAMSGIKGDKHPAFGADRSGAKMACTERLES